MFAICVSLAMSTQTSALPWQRKTNPEMTPVTIIKWPGFTHFPGAFLLSRVNLEFLNFTCSKLTQNMQTAIQVADILRQTKLQGVTDNQIKRYSYMFLQLESEYRDILYYLLDILLCSGRGGEHWRTFKKFNEHASTIWKLLREKDSQKSLNLVHQRIKANESFTPISIVDHIDSTVITNYSLIDLNEFSNVPISDQVFENDTLIGYLEQARPDFLRLDSVRQPRSPILVGLGIGFLGSYLFSNFFESKNDGDIKILNNNIQKINKNVRLTNERIDILAKNVSESFNTMKEILDKLVEAQLTSDIHQAILWNLDQLAAGVKDIKLTFKLGELMVTLLEKGIMNLDLLDLQSFEKIIAEGLKSFPNLEFPIKIDRFKLPHLVKMIKIEKVGRLKFLMVIPLTHKVHYETYTLIPHPITLEHTSLVIPEVRNTILINNDSYIITTKSNIYSVDTDQHLLLEVEPIYNHLKSTCEWEAFQKNVTNMIKLCNYLKVGQENGTFVVETDQHRLIYFTKLTKVSLNCPEKDVRETVIGLHKVSLACDIKTDLVFWPAKQSVTVDIMTNNGTDPFDIDSTYLPIVNLNSTSEIHTSLYELIDKLPKENDPFTIDFDYYNLTLEQIQSYSIYAQSILTIIVVINSLIIGFLFIKWIYKKKPYIANFTRNFRNSSIRDKLNKFTHVKDSVKSRQHRLKSSFRSRKNSLRSQRSQLRQVRDSIRSRSSSLKKKLRNKIPRSVTPPTNVEVGTNTELNWPSPPHSPHVYPPIPRYT